MDCAMLAAVVDILIDSKRDSECIEIAIAVAVAVMAILGHLGAILLSLRQILGLFWIILGPFGTIWPNWGFVHEQREGFTEH